MLAPVAHILPLTSIRRERLLPVPGRVVARLGQKVTPLDVVADANFGGEHLLINIAQAFGIKPGAAQGMVQVKLGESIAQDQVIAKRPGLVPQVFRSPRAGRVAMVGGGQILLEIGESTFELRAGIPGTISNLIQERGVEILFTGALVQGVWGNGQIGIGLMLPILSAPDEQLNAKQLDVSLRGSVLLAGYCNDPLAIQTGNELPLRGLILSSISPAILPQALQASYPIVVVDGFGRRPLNGAAYKLLTTNAKRDVTLNAQPFDCHTGARPEIFISLPVTQEPPSPRDVETLAPNQSVRLLRAPHAREIGTLVSLKPGLTSMPSGLRVVAAEIRLDSGEQIVVPLANLEILG